MPFLLLAMVMLALIFAPGLWVKAVLKRYAKPRPDLPGTGGELAAHLIERFELTAVSLETTKTGDHYDPNDRTIRLTEGNDQGRHLTAIATAAHEFGHALQHQLNYAPLLWRGRLVAGAMKLERLSGIALIALPVLSFIPGVAPLARVLLLVVVVAMLSSTLVHLVTLPVELDASFKRALPILQAGNYVQPDDLMAVRKILLACALTYVSQAAMSLLNIGRWLRLILRR